MSLDSIDGIIFELIPIYLTFVNLGVKLVAGANICHTL